ncbi:MAG: hypothetical protein E4G90_11550 [Gemmatimonadales bacterium]|nr:MAG: hypothetical protein E4G90_11550 [Gemmatimonadales bacterium]
MSDLLIVALVLLTIGWATLPLLPAIRELANPTDVEPLRMVGRDNADISRFARHFRDYIETSLRRLPAGARQGDYFGRLPDGTHFVRVAKLPGVLTKGAVPDGSHDRVVILEDPVVLEGDESFRLELFARADVTGGIGAEYRAVLGDGDVRLGAQSVVWRWIHASGTVFAGDGCALFGRTSSDTQISLGKDVGFERMGAPMIVVGDHPFPTAPPDSAEYLPFVSPDSAEQHGDHLRISSDAEIQEGVGVEGHLVVAGNLRIGRGARIRGSVKAHGEISLEPGAVVMGALVSGGSIVTGEGAWVKGPVIAEQQITLGPRTGVGDPAGQTTVSGRSVVLSPGSGVAGHIITSEGGHTAL